jgi:hypothetical protein
MRTESGRGEPRTTGHTDRLILVYDGDSGVRAMLADVLKKLVGREECALCEITYSPVGKRRAWAACERRLGLIVDEIHRDQIPRAWRISRTQLPCVLGRSGEEMPFVLLTRDEIVVCQASVERLERRIGEKLGAARSGGVLPAVGDALQPQNSSERRRT